MAERLLNYEVLERLGEGAGSTIYKVRDPTTGKAYALKHVQRVNPKDIRFIEQMETEYEISRHFSHPNLRRTFRLEIKKTLWLRPTEAFLVMELFEGMPLDKELPGTLIEILDTFSQAAKGLQAMHQMGFVHCDIKPNNILRDRSSHVKVIDFGQSCRAGTVKERIQGTPDYIAPEQVARKAVTPQTDLFNLGASLYWALTGRHIPTLYTVNKKGENSLLSDDLFQKPIELNPFVPQNVSDLVMECIATNPRKRPADMDRFIRVCEIGQHLIERQRAQAQAEASGQPLPPPDFDPHDSTIITPNPKPDSPS